MMETYSENRAAGSNNVGRPIIVYDDDSGEKNNGTSNSSSEIRISKVRRLPGRDISISSSEDEEYDESEFPKTIEIIEDPAKKGGPRKTSLVVKGAGGGGIKKLEIVDSIRKKDKNLTTSSSANELCKSTRFGELASPDADKGIPIRKRSVSFLPPSSEKTMDVKSSSSPTSKMGSVDLTREESVSEFDEDEELKGMDHLQVSVSDHARERRRSIENLTRPPTPPNASHSIKN